jgi:hypothetical protein
MPVPKTTNENIPSDKTSEALGYNEELTTGTKKTRRYKLKEADKGGSKRNEKEQNGCKGCN